MRIGVGLALLLVASVAAANTPPPEAKVHFEQGDKAYKLGDFARAIKEYQASFELFPAPLLLYDIAQAYRMLGENEKALFTYKQYLVDAPPGDFRNIAEEQVSKLEPLVEAERKTKKSPPTTTAKPDSTAADPQQQPKETAATKDEKPPSDSSSTTPAPRKWWILGVVGGVIVLAAIVAIVVAEVVPNNATPPPTSVGNAVITF